MLGFSVKFGFSVSLL